MVVCPWYMHFGVMFCIVTWQRKCIYSVKRGMFVESSLLMNLLIHDSSWITRASSTGKTAYSVSWLLRSSRLVKTRSEVHGKRNTVSIMLFRAELIEDFWTAILVQNDKISFLFIVMGMWHLFSYSGSLCTGYLKSFKMTLCMAGAIFFGVHDRGKPKPFSLPSLLLVDKANTLKKVSLILQACDGGCLLSGSSERISKLTRASSKYFCWQHLSIEYCGIELWLLRVWHLEEIWFMSSQRK